MISTILNGIKLIGSIGILLAFFEFTTGYVPPEEIADIWNALTFFGGISISIYAILLFVLLVVFPLSSKDSQQND